VVVGTPRNQETTVYLYGKKARRRHFRQKEKSISSTKKYLQTLRTTKSAVIREKRAQELKRKWTVEGDAQKQLVHENLRKAVIPVTLDRSWGIAMREDNSRRTDSLPDSLRIQIRVKKTRERPAIN
jgi:hypothetical protein